MIPKLASFCYRRRWIVLAAWVLIFIGVGAAGNAAGSGYSTTFDLGDRDSQVAQNLLLEKFPSVSGAEGTIVFKVDGGINSSPEAKAAVEQVFAEVAEVPDVATVVSPWSPEGAMQVSQEGDIAFATVQFESDWVDIPKTSLDEIHVIASDFEQPGVQLELGSEVFQEEGSLGSAELIGLAAAAIIILVAFGSVLAMGLPILTALFGVGIGIGAVGLLAHVISVPEFATQLGSMIGIGVGIDYALFIVTRYRQGLQAGLDPQPAVVNAINTSGRAVIFAGFTVVIALAGMLLIPLEFVQGLGIAAALVVLVTMAASVTLLPAILGFTGRNIDKWALPGANKPKPQDHRTIWQKWAGIVERHPWPIAVGGLLVLVILALPVLSMRLGANDLGSSPESTTVRRAYDLSAEGFGPGGSARFVIVAELPAGATTNSLAPLTQELQNTDGVEFALPAVANEDGTVAVMTVIPETSLQDAATGELLHHLRGDVLPAFEDETGVVFHVGGATAFSEDVTELLSESLPVFIGTVLALSFLLLLLVFRSVLVPLKAVIMNLLGIAAAYGIIVAVFQWGWGAGLIGVGREGPIQNFLPMMMFAILFGLSMDYEVFLLSRIKEEYDRTGDNSRSVADGLSHTARVITAAALIMVCVFGSFMLVDEPVVKSFGLGLAVAVLIDATIIRIVLVPATMELLGKANWWFPKWLNWLPEIHVDGNDVTEAPDIDLSSPADISAARSDPDEDKLLV